MNEFLLNPLMRLKFIDYFVVIRFRAHIYLPGQKAARISFSPPTIISFISSERITSLCKYYFRLIADSVTHLQ